MVIFAGVPCGRPPCIGSARLPCDPAIRSQQEVDGVPGLVDGPIQIRPLAPDPHVGLVHPPTAAHPTLAHAKGLIQQRRILQHPAIESGVVDLHAAFFHHLLELSIADRIRHIPAHTPEDDLSLKNLVGAGITRRPILPGPLARVSFNFDIAGHLAVRLAFRPCCAPRCGIVGGRPARIASRSSPGFSYQEQRMPDPDRDVEQAIRQVAHFIWEREGCLEGRARDHWCRAIIETTSCARAPSRARARWASKDFTYTDLYHPVRMICASPSASF